MVARTARRTLYPKRNGIFHIAAINDPKDCLPRAPIIYVGLRILILDALHLDSSPHSLHGSARGSCTLVLFYDVLLLHF